MRCHLHGGRAGRRPTSGKRTLEAQRRQHYLTILARVLRAYHPKPKPVPVVVDEDGRWVPVVERGR